MTCSTSGGCYLCQVLWFFNVPKFDETGTGVWWLPKCHESTSRLPEKRNETLCRKTIISCFMCCSNLSCCGMYVMLFNAADEPCDQGQPPSELMTLTWFSIRRGRVPLMHCSLHPFTSIVVTSMGSLIPPPPAPKFYFTEWHLGKALVLGVLHHSGYSVRSVLSAQTTFWL